MNDSSGMRVGIDLGGTKIEAIALGPKCEAFVRKRVPTPAGDYDRVLETIVALVAEMEEHTGQRGSVGIGTPGAVSAKTGQLKNANSTYLIGKNFIADITRKLKREIRVENDANCLTISEAVDGAGRDCRVVFGVILGTGVGGGLVVDGQIIRGANAIAGEFGHNPLPWPRGDEQSVARCYCGKHGCIEQFLSGPGLVRSFKEHTGREATTYEIVRAAQGGEPAAKTCLAEYNDRLARALASVVNVMDPDAIVLGGGLSLIERNHHALHEAVASYAFTDRLDTRIVNAVHGDASGVRGAAMLWP